MKKSIYTVHFLISVVVHIMANCSWANAATKEKNFACQSLFSSSTGSSSAMSLNSNSPAQFNYERDGFRFELIELSRYQQGSKEHDKAFSFLENIYFKSIDFLNLQSDFIQKIKDANQHLFKNSHLLLMYDSVDKSRVIGGAFFVVAKSIRELLALERESSVKMSELIPPQNYPIAEFARMAFDSQINDRRQKFKIMFEVIDQIFLDSTDIKGFYAFTTDFHIKNYRQRGYRINEILALDLEFQTEGNLKTYIIQILP